MSKSSRRPRGTPRNRALVNLMWETGVRPGEYLDLRVGSVKDRENGKSVVISGKTGPRRLPLVSSVPHLNTWLSQYPANGDPDAPLWCRLDGHPGERIDYNYFRKLMKELPEMNALEGTSNRALITALEISRRFRA